MDMNIYIYIYIYKGIYPMISVTQECRVQAWGTGMLLTKPYAGFPLYGIFRSEYIFRWKRFREKNAFSFPRRQKI